MDDVKAEILGELKSELAKFKAAADALRTGGRLELLIRRDDQPDLRLDMTPEFAMRIRHDLAAQTVAIHGSIDALEKKPAPPCDGTGQDREASREDRQDG